MELKESAEILNGNRPDCQQFLENVAVLERTLAEYQKIGTVDELREMKKNYKKFKQNKNKLYRDMHKKLKAEYIKGQEKALEAIGTVEEFKALKEKSVAKKPLCTTIAKDKDTSVGMIGRCPCCDGIIAEDMLWCEDCGQKLDWH
ncbi:MAG: hypothetical protein E7284_10105 [Lachnospiraceae bacterium]|nr:hypothetical protein [Lachnospiraceae bacterium]